MINWVWEGNKSASNYACFAYVNNVVQDTFGNIRIGRRV